MSSKRRGNAKCIPTNLDAIFLPYQEKWIKDSARLKVMEKSRQIGLSWSTAYPLVERTAAASARYDQWVSSRDEIQARLFLEDCKMWAQAFNMAAEDLGELVIDPGERLTALVLRFASGKQIYSMSSNPDAQAGKRGVRVLDEFALHKDPRKLWTIAYPGLTWGGQMEVISTHRGSRNFFNTDLVVEAREKGNPKQISLHRVTLQDALDQGFLFKLQQALPDEAEQQAMDEAAYFDFIKSGTADEESFLQEYMCLPGDDDAAFLEYDLIASCEYTKGEPWKITLEEAQTGKRELYAGVDIGRTRDLTVLCILERLGDVLYTRKIIALKAMSKPAQEKVLWPWLACIRRTCFDYTGLGIGWGDDAQAKFGSYRVELVTFTGPVKERLAYPVRGHLEEQRLRLPYDPVVRADLRTVTKTTTAVGNIRFTAERSEAGHADRFWALALAVEAASSPAGKIDYQSTGPRESRDAFAGETTIGPSILNGVGFGVVSGDNDFGGF
ncbi:phage terminase large subunit family protein [Candidatus Vondammii sp. HM_W22]|uniref:phage terminase large subunit family protein n=1 Tax=Candidatus Vondammii sp. HM_W22 TaxID=2687299 RepID=UPI001F1467D3|nr:terminase family protein [Candidatus Vondammii sp. HM_W22]